MNKGLKSKKYETIVSNDADASEGNSKERKLVESQTEGEISMRWLHTEYRAIPDKDGQPLSRYLADYMWSHKNDSYHMYVWFLPLRSLGKHEITQILKGKPDLVGEIKEGSLPQPAMCQVERYRKLIESLVDVEKL